MTKLFEDTWIRTDRSTSQFVQEFPVCTIDSSFDALKQKGETLIKDMETLMEQIESLSDEEISAINLLIEQMRKASNAESYHEYYDLLLQEYNRLLSLP